VASVEKSKEDIQIRCTKPAWQDAASTIPSNFEGWTLGNLVLGGIIGFGVDAATGAINEYPHTFQVPMTPLSAAAATPPAALAAPPPAPTATPAAVSGLTYPTSQMTVSSAAAGKTVLFPVTINNPYQPHWTVGGIQ
jgi:hypothetical protein